MSVLCKTISLAMFLVLACLPLRASLHDLLPELIMQCAGPQERTALWSTCRALRLTVNRLQAPCDEGGYALTDTLPLVGMYEIGDQPSHFFVYENELYFYVRSTKEFIIFNIATKEFRRFKNSEHNIVARYESDNYSLSLDNNSHKLEIINIKDNITNQIEVNEDYTGILLIDKIHVLIPASIPPQIIDMSLGKIRDGGVLRKGKRAPLKISHYEISQKWENDAIHIVDKNNKNLCASINIPGKRSAIEIIGRSLYVMDSTAHLYVYDLGGYTPGIGE